jgi:hypothetical protein
MYARYDDESRKMVAEALSRRVMLVGFGGLAAVVTGAAASQTAGAALSLQSQAEDAATATPMAQIGVEALTGRWTYRSFVNDPTFPIEDCETLQGLFFGQAELVIDAFAPGDFRGRLIFEPGAEMALIGASSFGNPFTIRFQGRGDTPPTAEFVYDYVGYLVPVWPHGVDQRPALVGSIVRTEPHSGGAAEPGFVASWIAVKQD